MKKKFRPSVMLLTFLGVVATGCGNNPRPVAIEALEPTAEQLIQKGEYLVRIMGCNDCHSPKQMGPEGPVVIPEIMLSGYPANRPQKKVDPAVIRQGWNLLNEDFTLCAGQWGVSFAANLTSDQTGIGSWTEENFKRALKEGKYKGLKGTRMLLPPMPWTNFTSIEDKDVMAIFGYLKSTKPIKNVIPMPVSPEELK